MKKLATMLIVAIFALALAVSGYAAVSTVASPGNGTYTYIANVTFALDSDTYGSVTHSLGGTATQYEYTLTAIDANCGAAHNSGAILNTAMPYINDVSSTTIGVAKQNIKGSSTCAVRLTVRNIHSIIQ